MLPRAGWSVVHWGRHITEQEIAQIRETVHTFGRLSRTELAETICEHLHRRTASGSNKVDACLKLLEKMESRGFFRFIENCYPIAMDGAQKFKRHRLWEVVII